MDISYSLEKDQSRVPILAFNKRYAAVYPHRSSTVDVLTELPQPPSLSPIPQSRESVLSRAFETRCGSTYGLSSTSEEKYVEMTQLYDSFWSGRGTRWLIAEAVAQRNIPSALSSAGASQAFN